MNVEKVKKAYKELSLILYRRKYLIPQKPQTPLNFPLTFSNIIRRRLTEENPKTKYSQKQIWAHAKKYMDNNDQGYLKLKAQHEAMVSQHKANVKKYTEEYINPPLLFVRFRPINYFISKLARQAQSGQKMDVGTCSKIFRDLSAAQKDKIGQQCLIEIEKQLPKYNQYVAKHLIPSMDPELNKTTSYNLFVSENSMNLGEAGVRKNREQINSEYISLGQLELRKLEERANERNRHRSEGYEQFLKRWDLTEKQLNYIITISTEYNDFKGKKTKLNKNNIQSGPDLLYFDNDTETEIETEN